MICQLKISNNGLAWSATYTADDGLCESRHLVLVHLGDLPPVGRDFRKVERLAEVDQVEDVLLEARSSESDGSFQELGSDTGVETAGVRDFVNVGSGDFADGRKGVDRGDALSKHGIGGLQ